MPRLSTIIGHEAPVARLRASITNGSVGHAYLFAGPAGTGKTTLARALAKALNCARAGSLIGGDADSCDLCDPCRQIDAGVFPDVHLVRPALLAAEAEGGERGASAEIRISQVRDLRKMMNLSPAAGRRKVFIVSPAEAMNEQAQNALLKSLEEPPPASTLILCTESAESILPTIQSRCQVVQFGLAPRDLIARKLRELAGLSQEEAAVAAALSQGRVGWAFRFASQPEWRAARAALLDLALSAMRRGPLQALQSAADLRAAAAKLPILEETLSGGDTGVVSERLAGRIQLQLLFEELAVMVRDLLILRAGASDPSLLVNADRIDALRSVARDRSGGRLRTSLGAVLTAKDLLVRNVNPQLLLEDVLLELSWG